jgi:acetyltransferase-like isoleucine patch superfamily enzyme
MPVRGLYVLCHTLGAVARRLRQSAATCYHRATLGQVGTGCVFGANVRFYPPSNVKFGDRCVVAQGTAASTEALVGHLQVGSEVQINRHVHLDMTGGLVIGDAVLISEQAVIYTHNHGHDPRMPPDLCPKTIEAGAWIGMRAVILPGCRKIGAGAVIGAGSIVVKDVPAGAIVAGNPARVIGTRTQDRQVA